MLTRRQLLQGTGAALVAGAALPAAIRTAGAQNPAVATRPPLRPPTGQRYTPVVTLNGGSLPWTMIGPRALGPTKPAGAGNVLSSTSPDRVIW